MIVGRHMSNGFSHFCTSSEHGHLKLLCQTIFSTLYRVKIWKVERMSFSRAEGSFVCFQINKDDDFL